MAESLAHPASGLRSTGLFHPHRANRHSDEAGGRLSTGLNQGSVLEVNQSAILTS